MSLTNNDRKIRSESGNSFPQARFAVEIAGALHRQYDAVHAGVEVVVQLTGANERTVRNWFDAKNGPSGELLVALCAHCDEVLATVLKLAGRELQARAVKIAFAQRAAHDLCAILDALDDK
jgi:hypothetical protein